MPIPTLSEKLEWLKPAPMTLYERECAAKIPRGDYEIGVQTTNDILEEAMEVFVRSSRSYFGVSGDSMVAIFTASGDLVNAACGTYLHAIIQPIIVKFVLKHYKENPGIREGDIWYTNDALYGGIHNPDQVALMPIFYRGKLLAWASAALHTTETGAIEPGGMPVSARSRFEEGLNLPPIKIAENYELRNDFLEFYSVYGLRAPAMFISDLRARCTTADRVRVRLLELVEKRGPEFVVGLLHKMCDTAEAGARKKIEALPNGKFRGVVFNDAIGWTPALVRSCYLTVTKQDGRIIFDFQGTSPENASSYNVHPQAVVGHIANFMYEYFFHDLPIASSTFAPIDFVFPECIILNPSPTAATSCCVFIGMQTRCATHNSFARMMFSSANLWRQVAASPGTQHTSQICAGLSQWKLAVADILSFALNTQGQGGRATGDGMDSYGFAWCAFGRAPDSEQVESELPLTITLSQHWKDSCGHGRHRGGAGAVQQWMVHKVPELVSLCMGNGSKVPLFQPLFGGYASAPIPGISIRKSDLLEKMQKGDPQLALDHRAILGKDTIKGEWKYELIARTPQVYQEGDVLFGFSGGGPGYGDPLEREPDAVLEDLVKQIISDWTAQNIYHVVYDPERRKLDAEKTRQKRDGERRARLARGKPYAEFVQEWSKKSPPKDVLQWYGTWPDAKPTGPVFRP
ncbi:MAG TPA: hydantoinase B/oxoprolinase family protein [Candidatus Acidoferrales bacterium]|nr:hydantoinase B/oxoprolinase family protein [Candidatus Acidoferrales bacterium]